MCHFNQCELHFDQALCVRLHCRLYACEEECKKVQTMYTITAVAEMIIHLTTLTTILIIDNV